jgi:N-acetyl-beta-hexosaminidase
MYSKEMTRITMSLVFVAIHAAAVLAAQSTPGLVPWPNKVELSEGRFALTPRSRIVYSSDELKPLAEVLADDILLIAALDLELVADDGVPGDIVLRTVDDLSGEAYGLKVMDRVLVSGGSYQAVASGTATLLQLLDISGDGVALPLVSISDEPAYSYRGWMIDVARHPHSLDTLKQAVQLCRLYKVRYLHLHLTDNEGWTFPSKTYPQLGTKNTRNIPRYDLDKLKALVSFADRRGVTIVPELGTPGHSGAARRCMPEVFDSLDEDGKSRYINIMNMGNEKIYEVLDVLIGEMAEVFASSPYIHIGCDEAWLAKVDKTPEAEVYMKRHDLENGYDMYCYHIVRMNEMIKARGKQTIVWEGFHNSGSKNVEIPKDIIVMPFENTYNSAPNLARHGYTMINTAWSPLYITRWVRFEPEMIYKWNVFRFGIFPWQGYDFINWLDVEPTADVIGAQVCNWEQTENYVIPSTRKRVPAMIERIWNPDAEKSYAEFEHRWRSTNEKLAKLILPVEISATGLWRPDPEPEDDNIWLVDHSLFEKQVTVTLSAVRPLRNGEVIRYTLDGEDPTAESPVYREPFVLTKDNCEKHSVTVKGRLFFGDEPVGHSSWADYMHDWQAELPQLFKWTVYDVPRYVERLSDYIQTIPSSALSTEGKASGLRGEYFANTRFEGEPAFTRVDEQIDFNWGHAGPGDGVGADGFSVRWRGKLTVPETGDYILATANDDGARLYLDGRRIVDDWSEHPVRINRAELRLQKGKSYDLVLEYFENRGEAEVKLLWQKQPFNPEKHLPVVGRGTSPSIEIGPRTPKPERGYKHAHVFTGSFDIPADEAGEHQVSLRTTKATGQLFINGELLIDRQETDWSKAEATIELSAGTHDVKLIFIGGHNYTMAVDMPGQYLELQDAQ